MKGQTVFAPLSVSGGVFAHGCAAAEKRLAAAGRAGKNLPQSGGAQIANIRLTHTLGNE